MIETRQQLENRIHDAICRAANDIKGAVELDDSSFDDAVSTAVYDATACLAGLLPKGKP